MRVLNCNTSTFAPTATERSGLKARYQALLEGRSEGSAAWLDKQLAHAASLPDDLPDTPLHLPAWSVTYAAKVAAGYAEYLEQRRQGAPRRFFANRAHALWFLQQVAPTKAVDGAWLHGALQHWHDPRFHGLIRTHLEELGNGDPRCNHVLIYQRLLDRLGCTQAMPLDDTRYLQGTLQLALGQHGDRYLPEVIGYNLGYEQPPLHLLITICELAELGIDGQYFQLHVTIDNAASGHARLSIQALSQLCPQHDKQAFYARVRCGYRLNDLGIATPDLICQFDLQAELFAALERKRVYGQFMHADHCRLQQRTINQWLTEPGAMPAFVAALQAQGWIRRGQPPAESRWWNLIEGPAAAMFGVFNAYEKQLWHDWIADDWRPAIRRVAPGSWGLPEAQGEPAGNLANEAPAALIMRMAGNRHATPDGLLATRAYIRTTGMLQEEPR